MGTKLFIINRVVSRTTINQMLAALGPGWTIIRQGEGIDNIPLEISSVICSASIINQSDYDWMRRIEKRLRGTNPDAEILFV